MRVPFVALWFAILFVPASSFADHHEEAFMSIFDGKSLEGWDGNPKFWSVKDGAITGTTTKENPTIGNTFIIWRGDDVSDFELRLQFKIVGGNSGIQYRSEDKGNWVVGGYQADFEAGSTYSGILYEERGRGILAQRGQVTEIHPGDKPKINVIANIGDTKVINEVIKKEDWNDYKIIANGNQFMHIINDRMTCQVIDHDEAKGAKSGVLALQLHAGPPMTVQFKDIRIRPLEGIDIAGKWDFEVITEQGTGEPKFTFKSDGKKLTGDYSGAFGESTVEGTINGAKVSWTVDGTYNGQDITSEYEGKFTSFDSMMGTVVFGGQYEAKWTAERK